MKLKISAASLNVIPIGATHLVFFTLRQPKALWIFPNGFCIAENVQKKSADDYGNGNLELLLTFLLTQNVL